MRTKITDCVLSPLHRRDYLTGAIITLLILAVYSLNGDYSSTNDAKSNNNLPITMLRGHGLAFLPSEAPFLFVWRLRNRDDLRLTTHWNNAADAAKLRDLYQNGRIELVGPSYYLALTVQRDGSTGEHLYADTFGPGAGLTALPAVSLYNLLVPDLARRQDALGYCAKFVASLCAALSAGIFFLIARGYVSEKKALLFTFAYGCGTCVWSGSSQALLQHGPNELFLALGALLLLRGSKYGITAAGLCFGCATVCRATSFLFIVAVAVGLFLNDRKLVKAFVAGILPPLVFLALYNCNYFGSPFTFGETAVSHQIALQTTGSEDVWQTPLWIGLPGVLFSPSRGLFIFSPFLMLAVSGAWVAWRSPQYRWLRPYLFAIAADLLIASHWFDWWSGWSYGYVHIVDDVFFLTLFLLPMADSLMGNIRVRVLFGVLLAWSIFVQFIGAFAYDLDGWNARRDSYGNPIDLRSRVWSVSDNEIGYYLMNFAASRHHRREAIVANAGG